MSDDPGLSVQRLTDIERLTKAAIFEGDSPVAVGATLAAAASDLLAEVQRIQAERDTLRALLIRLDTGDYTTVRLDDLTAVTQRCADLEAENQQLRRRLVVPVEESA